MRCSDLPRVVAMLKTSFDSRVTPYMTYAQSGAGAFLEVPLLYPQSFVDRFFTVSTNDRDEAIGFAEFRMMAPGTGFLSYICVDHDFRGLGVASSLIEAFVNSRQSLEELELDVFDNNLPALRLYEKFGFARGGQKAWLSRCLPSPSVPLSISQPHAAAAIFATYGFCETTAEWRSIEVRLGRIGTDVLRCFNIESFSDNALLASARATFPSPTVALIITSARDKGTLPPGTTTVALSNRLTLRFGAQANISRKRL